MQGGYSFSLEQGLESLIALVESILEDRASHPGKLDAQQLTVTSQGSNLLKVAGSNFCFNPAAELLNPKMVDSE